MSKDLVSVISDPSQHISTTVVQIPLGKKVLGEVKSLINMSS